MRYNVCSNDLVTIYEVIAMQRQRQPDLIRIGRAAALIGVTAQTLRNWDKDGILKPAKVNRGTRYYDIDDVRRRADNLTHLMTESERQVRFARRTRVDNGYQYQELTPEVHDAPPLYNGFPRVTGQECHCNRRAAGCVPRLGEGYFIRPEFVACRSRIDAIGLSADGIDESRYMMPAAIDISVWRKRNGSKSDKAIASELNAASHRMSDGSEITAADVARAAKTFG